MSKSPLSSLRHFEPVCEVDELVALWPHVGEAAVLVRELKYRRTTAVVSALAEPMAELAPAADLVTWVPATPARRRERGFDQSELLARAIARRARLKARRMLRRVDNRAQTGRNRDGRIEGPTIAPAGRLLRSGPTVLLIDDVCTTGSTLRACARVLRSRGAVRVVALVATQVEARPTTHTP